MPAAVDRIALALDEAGLLELVQQADEPAAVVAERVGDRGLGAAGALVEQGQHRVVVRARADGLVGLRARSLIAQPSRFSRNDVLSTSSRGGPTPSFTIGLVTGALIGEKCSSP